MKNICGSADFYPAEMSIFVDEGFSIYNFQGERKVGFVFVTSVQVLFLVFLLWNFVHLSIVNTIFSSINW